MTRIVAISDTHGQWDALEVPEGDVLVHAGDITARGALRELIDFNRWLAALPHPHKVVIAGNHDWCFAQRPADARGMLTAAHYLQDEGVELCGLRFWGSPWQPRFFDWAFNLNRGAPLRKVWAQIPDDTDVLVTHGPAWGILDLTPRGERVGCEELTLALQRVKPRLHIFGHIHHSHGLAERGGVIYANASVCTEQYRPINPPLVIEV